MIVYNKIKKMKILNYPLLACLIVLSLSALSCKKSVKSLIDNGSFKYWEADDNRGYYYYFGSDFKCKVFHRKIDDSLEEYIVPDVIYPSTWSLGGDSIITFRNQTYKINKIIEDEMILENKNRVRILRLVPNSQIPECCRKKI